MNVTSIKKEDIDDTNVDANSDINENQYQPAAVNSNSLIPSFNSPPSTPVRHSTIVSAATNDHEDTTAAPSNTQTTTITTTTTTTTTTNLFPSNDTNDDVPVTVAWGNEDNDDPNGWRLEQNKTHLYQKNDEAMVGMNNKDKNERTRPPTPYPYKTTGLLDSDDESSDGEEIDLTTTAPTNLNHKNVNENYLINDVVIESDDEPEVNEPAKKKAKTKQATLEMVGIQTTNNTNAFVEEVTYQDFSPCGVRKGDLILTTAMSAGHPEYIKNKLDGRFQLVGKVVEYVEKVYKKETIIYKKREYLHVKYAPIKKSDGTYHSSAGCALTKLDECFKILHCDDGDLLALDEGTAVNVRNGFRFVGGRWMMKYAFGW